MILTHQKQPKIPFIWDMVHSAKWKILEARMSKIHAACGAHQASFVALRWFIDLTSGRLALTNTVRRLGYRLAGVFIVLQKLETWRCTCKYNQCITSCRVWIQSAAALSKELKAGRDTVWICSFSYSKLSFLIFSTLKLLSFFKIWIKKNKKIKSGCFACTAKILNQVTFFKKWDQPDM